MNSTKSISFLDTKNGNFSLINGVVISSKTTFSELREQFPNNDIWDVGTGFYWIYFEKCPFEGKEFDILIERFGKRSREQLMGRTPQNKAVVIARGNHHIGETVRVRITGSTSATLFGEEV